MRHYSPLDQLIMQGEHAMRTIFGQPEITERHYPAENINDCQLDEEQRKHVAGLMRINHAGEIAAQALYSGQALTARLDDVRESMNRAALEENDHLDWTNKRLQELGSQRSLLAPFWYAGSFAIGAAAGAAGDKWSLGFVAETEKQVVRHLQEHLEKLPDNDQRSRAILQQMKEDEQHHATVALEHGGRDLPWIIRKLMTLTSKVMTKTAYRL
ncbi:MAG: 2-polyprenyl-3-methyl-6-methoxy-1,4-benzoquinone monooxygenase [Gammaproteobacteria bacterium]|nr:2-polyprenyl-3-methyl-6-methoxy-1,4-benzoquinone monooxygenase [Gammaproteobacteria bacterium]